MTKKFYITPGHHFNGLTIVQTRELILDGLADFSVVCGLKWVEVNRRSQSHVAFEFHPNGPHTFDKYVWVDGIKKPSYSLGRGHTNGKVVLNTSRNLGGYERVVGNNRRLIQVLVQHEVMHVFRWKHAKSADRDHVMHGHISAKYWHPTEVIALQRKFGKPEKPFYPIPRGIVGKRVRDGVKEMKILRPQWESALKARSELKKDWRKDHPIELDFQLKHANITKLSKKLGKDSKEWHRLNNAWKKVGSVAGG